jgi:hypothetical protein
MKFVLGPVPRVGVDVCLDESIFVCIADDMLMVTRLPSEEDPMLAGESGHPYFNPAHDGGKVLRPYDYDDIFFGMAKVITAPSSVSSVTLKTPWCCSTRQRAM